MVGGNVLMAHPASFPTPVFAATQPEKVDPLPTVQKFTKDGNDTAHGTTEQANREKMWKTGAPSI